MATTPKLWTAHVSYRPDPGEYGDTQRRKVVVRLLGNPEHDEVRVIGPTLRSPLDQLRKVAALFGLEATRHDITDGTGAVIESSWYLADVRGANVARVELGEDVTL